MQLAGTGSLPARALRLANMLARVTQPNPKDGLDAMVAEDTLQPVFSVYESATTTCPAFYAARSGDTTIVLIAGCTIWSHASAVIEEYSGGYFDSLTLPVNKLWSECADRITSILHTNALDVGSDWVLVGHSFGGTIATYMLQSRITEGNGATTWATTFGSPKYGNTTQAQGLTNANLARWFGSDDPVPLVPPTTQDSIAVAVVFSLRELTRFGNFVQPAGGLQITPAGEITSAIVPASASMSTVMSLTGWLLAIDGSSASGHHIAAYQARLALWITNHPTVNNPPAQGGGVLRVTNDNRRVVNAAEQRAFQQLQDLAERQNAQPVLIPPAQLFRVRRDGRTYIVTFGDTVVSVSPHKSGAHQLARTWNAALRSLQHQPLVETDDLLQQLQAYTDVAADPDSGIRPTLNTHLPG